MDKTALIIYLPHCQYHIKQYENIKLQDVAKKVNYATPLLHKLALVAY